MLGEEIKKGIEKKGITQKALAEEIGITGSALTRFIKDERRPSIQTLFKIIDLLDLDVKEVKRNIINK
jgi:transcriptional regulator with XRE-family HTH domain